jgi:hypothetical protein
MFEKTVAEESTAGAAGGGGSGAGGGGGVGAGGVGAGGVGAGGVGAGADGVGAGPGAGGGTAAPVAGVELLLAIEEGLLAETSCEVPAPPPHPAENTARKSMVTKESEIMIARFKNTPANNAVILGL